MCRLFHLPLSPFCRKIRLVLAEKKLDVDLVEEPVWEKRADFLKKNPAAKIPILSIGNNILAESNAIFEYLEEVYPSPALLPAESLDRFEARRISAWFDDKFNNEVSSKLLYERVNKKLFLQGYPDSQAIKKGLHILKFHLSYFDSLLSERNWMAGRELTVADFSAAAHFSVLDYIGDLDWSITENLKEWYMKLKSRPAFRSILKDQVPGFVPSSHYADLDF